MEEIAMDLFFHQGYFRTWLYTPTHSTLVIRGEKVADNGRNIDVKFGGIFYAEIVQEYRGLAIRRPTLQQIQELRTRSPLGNSRYDGPDLSDTNASGGYYLLESEGVSHFVAASFLYVEYNSYLYDKVTIGEGIEIKG